MEVVLERVGRWEDEKGEEVEQEESSDEEIEWSSGEEDDEDPILQGLVWGPEKEEEKDESSDGEPVALQWGRVGRMVPNPCYQE